MEIKNVAIATIRPWNLKNALKLKELLSDKYEVYIYHSADELREDTLRKIEPTYIFFPHWSWKVPESIYSNYECIGFHMSDLPFGRGGSPLQNLIKEGIHRTKITAFRITKDLDAGDIYLKRELFIGLGSAEEIYMLASEIIFFDMIPYILTHRPTPEKQKGEITYFRRRKPEQSDLKRSGAKDLRDIYDFIRMLDAEGYPRAFIRVGDFKIIFSEAHLKHDRIVGRFEIIEDEQEKS